MYVGTGGESSTILGCEATPVSAVGAPTARWRAALRHDDYRLLFISLLPGTLGMMTFAAMPLSSLPASRLPEAIGLPGTLLLCGVLSTASVILGTWGSGSELSFGSVNRAIFGRRL